LGGIQTHWNINPWSEIAIVIAKCMLGMVVKVGMYNADKPTMPDEGPSGKYSKFFKYQIPSLPVGNQSLKYP
jgi:hypothetical protein